MLSQDVCTHVNKRSIFTRMGSVPTKSYVEVSNPGNLPHSHTPFDQNYPLDLPSLFNFDSSVQPRGDHSNVNMPSSGHYISDIKSTVAVVANNSYCLRTQFASAK